MNSYKRDLKTPFDLATEARFATGHSIGKLAQQLYPDGKDATPEKYSAEGLEHAVENTRKWIDNGETVIYEAAFFENDVFAAVDILIKDSDGWLAIEVKSSSSVKEYHLNDTAIQFYVLTAAGLTINDIGILHVDSNYIRHGDLELDKLFQFTSVLSRIEHLQENIRSNVKRFKQVLASREEPKVDIGPHCTSPFECDFKAHCWDHVPRQSVFDIGNFTKKWDAYQQGIVRAKDLTPEYTLSTKQEIELRTIRSGEVYLDKEAIADFLSDWEYPLFFFDFETINPTVPLYEGSSPFEQIPFQYSLHIIREPGSEAEHLEFLPEPAGDPRPELVASMLEDLETSGTIVAYNMPFEKGVINALARHFPEKADQLRALNERFDDLIIPFRNKWCYHPDMSGKTSIKYVLPALIPELSYDDLAIANGMAASQTYLNMLNGSFSGHQPTTMKQLRAYCERDTYAMVALFHWLANRCI